MVIAQETVLRKYVNFDAGHILPPTAILALSAVYAVKSSVAKTLKCEECSLHGRKFVTRGPRSRDLFSHSAKHESNGPGEP